MDRRRILPFFDHFESRQLLTGSLTVVLTEAATLQSVTIVDGDANDTDPTLGSISYSTPTTSPFADFTITGLQASSNKNAIPANSYGQILQSGTVFRTTSTAGAKVLTVTVSDTGFAHPVLPTSLDSSAGATFTNATALDSTTFQSFADTIASPLITLVPNLARNPDAESGFAPTTALTIPSPFDLSNTFTINLGPSSLSRPVKVVKFQNTGSTTVAGQNPLNVSGTVFADLNHNNTQELGTESGIAGVPVTLTGTDFAGNPVSLTTTTGTDGSYNFTVLFPSNAQGYTIVEGSAPGYLHEGEAAGSTGGTTSSRTITTVLPALTNSLNNNFSEEQTAAVNGYVYVDANNNGLKDTGEIILPGVPVTLSGTDILGNPVTVNGTTDINGFYNFPGLRPGTYTVTETAQPGGYLDGQDTKGNVTPITGSASSDVIAGITVGFGQTAANNNFGELLPAGVSGYVYYDKNNDGTFQGTEAAIPGTVVTLTGSNDLGAIAPLTATTDANGFYSFTGLRPGTYVISESQPSTYLDGKDTVGTGATTPTTVTANDQFSVGLAAGDSGVNNNFGELLPASIAGTVYFDADKSGTYNTGDSPIAAVSITLTGTNDLGQSVTVSGSTDSNGNFSFSGLRPGTYTVTETQPAAYGEGTDAAGTAGGSTAVIDVTSGAVLTAGQNATGYLFGEVGTALSGTVYIDANKNAALDGIETGRISGVTITLYDSLGNAIATATTDANGFYSFPNLLAGSYTVIETQPTGYGSSTSNTLTVTLPTTGLTNQNFGETLGSLAGYVYYDANDNGLKTAGETGLTGVTVKLTGTDVYGASVSVTTTTDALGYFQFTGLVAGTYTITEPTQPAGYNDGSESINTTVLANTIGTDAITSVGLAAGADQASYNFGEVLYAAVSGYVYVDANNNGLKDTGETILPNVSVTLTGTNDLGAAVTVGGTTDANGFYNFPGLRPGTYTVTEAQPGGYLDGQDTKGNVTPIAGSATTDAIAGITVVAGQTAINNNFGEIVPSSLSGVVYCDGDFNGSYMPGEQPFSGVTINLVNAANTVIATTTTAANGTYSFGNLYPGTYSIVEATQPANKLNATNNVGTLGGTVVGDSFTAIAVGQGQSGVSYNFGEKDLPITAFLQGEAFADLNNNGVLDTTDAPLAGATIALYNSANSLVASQVTGADGIYRFTNLAPGNYTLVETPPTAYANSGSQPLSQFNPATSIDIKTIKVTVVDPNTISATNTSLAVGSPDTGTVYLNGVGTTVYLAPDNIQLSGPGVTSGSYIGYCVDLGHLLSGVSTYNVQPDYAPMSPGVATNAGQIAYLFNHFGASAATSASTAAGLQLAIWELEYDTGTPDLSSGHFSVSGETAADLAAATSYLAAAQGHSEVAAFLNINDCAASTGRQGMIALDSLNFGNVQTVSIAGSVYFDKDASGSKTSGDVPLGSVTVTLTGTDDLGHSVSIVGATNATGAYSFTNLRPGTYTLTETQPAGYNQGSDTAGTSAGVITVQDVISAIMLPGGTNATGYNFGELGAGISGTVYLDADLSTTYNTGDSPLAGVTVTLKDSLGNVVATTTSGTNGSYSFPNVAPGNYTIVETPKTGYGTDTPVILPVTQTAAGLTNQNFGETLGALSGTVYYDKDASGTITAGDVKLAGVTVTLKNGSGMTVGTATTDANGFYKFTGLLSSTYTIIESQPAGYNQGTDAVGSLGGTAVVQAATTDTSSGIVLNGGAIGTGYNFGELGAGISGTVYLDADLSTTYNTGDSPLAGVTVTLKDSLGNVVSTTTTGANGSYSFPNVAPGNYTIVETPKTGYGTDTPVILPVTQTAAGLTNQNFGETLGALSGTVYFDADKSGTLNTGDVKLAGVSVMLKDSGGNTVGTAVTDANGNYTFTGLVAGTYTIVEAQPAAYLQGTDTTGSLGGTAAVQTGTTDTVGSIVVPAGTAGSGYNFGEIKPSSLSGSVYVDANNDGIKQGTETGIANVTVTLTGTDDKGASVTLTSLTGSDGSYSFANLRPGTYVLTETQPAAYTDGKDTIGSPGGTATNDKFSNIVLAQNVNGTANNFGEIAPIAITGTVYLDKTGNGLSGDDGIFTPSSVTVKLYADTNNNGVFDTGDAVVSVYNTSTGLGTFSFTTENQLPGNPLLPLGTYFVQQVTPNGFIQTGPALPTTYTVAATTPGTTYNNNNFDNFQFCNCTDTGVYYTINGCSTHFTDLRGNTHQGDVVTVHFQVSGPGASTLTLVSYVAPGSSFDANAAGQQTIYQVATGTFAASSSNWYTMTVQIPSSYYQVDFVCGQAIDHFGPANSNVFYSAQCRLISADNGGTVAAGFLAGYVYYDANDNGVRSSEAGIGGVTVKLYNSSSSTTPYLTTTTDANGYYQFTNLPADTYKIVEVQPSGYIDGTDALGTAGGSLSANDVFSGINLTRVSPGYATGTDYNFGEVKPALISGYAYIDANTNGCKDSGETGLSGVTVTLTGTDDHGSKVSTTTTTAGDGSYSFGTLRPGTYTVTETQPAGYTSTGDSVGSAGGTAFNSSGDGVANIVLGSNASGTGYNFGEISFTTSNSCGVQYKDAGCISFWAGSKGQSIIKSLNGDCNYGNTSTALASWLTSQFPNLFPTSLIGTTNASVASYARSVKPSWGNPTEEAQVLAVALSYYTSNSGLSGGNYTQGCLNYGQPTTCGLAIRTTNVGTCGASFGLTNNGNYSILTTLKAINMKASNGTISSSCSSSAYTVFTNILNCGGV